MRFVNRPHPGILFNHGPLLCGLGAIPVHSRAFVPDPLFLEYPQVDLGQKYSEIRHRSEIELRTQFSRNIWVNIPVSTAPMATVTGAKMAIALGLLGGIGVLRRDLAIEQQAAEVHSVKHKAHINQPIQDPIALTQDHTKEDALRIFNECEAGRRVGSIPIVNNAFEHIVVGIITPRDTKGNAPLATPLRDLMSTPCAMAQIGISIEDARKILLDDIRKKQLPLVNETGRLRGLITLQDIELREKFPYAALDAQGRLLCAAAVGLNDLVERAEGLIVENPDVFVLDIAHGGMREIIEAIRYLKSKYDIDVVATNVHEPELVEMVRNAGADGCRIGIGPGAECTTRAKTGVGGSQLTAILRCAEVARDMPVIADGGIREEGDIGKALAAGASCVMIGTLFAGTDEAPGELERRGNTLYKKHFGMSSNEARMILENLTSVQRNEINRLAASPEGRDYDWVPYQGSVCDIIASQMGYVRSTMSYVGARTVADMKQCAKFNIRHE